MVCLRNIYINTCINEIIMMIIIIISSEGIGVVPVP